MWSVCIRRRLSSQAMRMWRADKRPSLGQSDIAPNSFVARTTFSRRPPPWANHRPMIDSVAPTPLSPP